MTGHLLLGADIGGTKLAAGVVTPDGELLSFRRTPTPPEPGPALDALAGLCRDALAAARIDRADVAAVGIGCGGPLDRSAGVVSPVNLPGWRDVPVSGPLADALGLPATLDNDATAAALAEARWGAGRGLASLVYLTISTGIGGGVVLDGQPYRGAGDAAAEFGHASVRFDGPPCSCGGRGCLEGYASGTAIAAHARAALREGLPSSMLELAGSIDAVDAATVAAAAATGDAVAGAIWQEAVEALGAAVAAQIAAFDPAIVVLGGGVTGAGELLLDPVRRIAHERSRSIVRREVPIVRSRHGECLGVLGAAALAAEATSLDPGPDLDVGPLGTLRRLADDHMAVAVAVSSAHLAEISAIAQLVEDVIERGGRVWTCGNGGSAADAQHLAAELVGHFAADRGALPAVSLATDPSVVTAVANDYSFDDVFARQVEAHARPGDLVVGFTTSGESENVVRALLAARRLGAATVAFTGGISSGGGRAARLADRGLVVPSDVTARVQEVHLLALHLVSSLVDEWAAERTRPNRADVR